MVSNPVPAGLFSIDQTVTVLVHDVELLLHFLLSLSEMGQGFRVGQLFKSESVAWLSLMDDCHPVSFERLEAMELSMDESFEDILPLECVSNSILAKQLV